MQVQNFVSNNSLCGSNLHTSTTYIMTANNRNVINLPMQTTSGPIKNVFSNSSSEKSLFAPKSRTLVKKTYVKKRVLNLAIPKLNLSVKTNNNSTNVKNRNSKISSASKTGKSQSSQNNYKILSTNANESKSEDDAKVKQKEAVE